MKIALCLFNYFPFGGLQKNFMSVAKALLDRQHELIVYTGEWKGEQPEGLTIKYLPRRGLSNPAKNQCFANALKKTLKKNPVDLVVGFNKIPGLDVYYCADTCFATKAYEKRGLLYRLTPRSRLSLEYEKAVFGKKSKTKIMLLSRKEGAAFKKYYGTDEQRMQLMPPGIARDRVRHEGSDAIAQKTREGLGISEDCKVLAFVGSYFKTKGLDRLLEAYASIQKETRENTRLLVIGTDKRQQDYEQNATQLGIENNVLFLGQRSDVPNLLFASDMLIHPARVDNTGNVLLEAAVAGAPAICSDACGYASYVKEHQLGIVLDEPFQQRQLNQALAEMIKLHDDKQDQYRQSCKTFAESADIYSRITRIADYIEQAGADRCS